MTDLKDEIFLFVSKVWALFFYVLLGIMAKFSLDLVQGKRISFLQGIGSVGISLFVGFLAAVWCMNNNSTLAPYIVPICTLSADKILTVILSIDWKDFIGYFIKKK